MIHFSAETQTFNITLYSSYYACQVDAEGRLVHLVWGPRPTNAANEVLGGNIPHPSYELDASFITQFRPDEILTFGDVTSFHTTLKANFPSLPQPVRDDEAAHLPIRDLRLRYVSHEITESNAPDLQPALAPKHGLPVLNSTPRETLRILLRDPIQAFDVTACYRITAEQDIIERWLELENTGEEIITFDKLYFASLHMPNGATELTRVTGAWAQEFTAKREELSVGTRILESRSLQTSHYTNPFFMLNRPGQAWEESGTVYFGALAYSGSWELAFEQLPTWNIRVHGGYNTFDDKIRIAPGEKHVTPAFVTGACPNGWGGASRRMHAFTRERILPRPKRDTDLRPVLYNSWEATYFDLSYQSQVELARKAASIGVELFCLDDGWFGNRRNDYAGLGDWFVRKDAFPEGLEQLVKEVHRLGMKFGLWVEPEMVNPDSELYRAHPDWVLHFPSRPRTEVRNQLMLDFGREEVVAYIFNVLDELVDKYSVSFFKWDMNRLATEPGSVAGQMIWRAHVAGVYSIMDRLRAKHPGLDIQSCSGGGGRIDLGIMGRTDQVWTSDNTDAFDRIRIQEGFGLVYPARTMEAWVTHEHNHQTQRITPLKLRFDVAMRGVLGIGSSLNQLEDAELAEYARYIAFYKKIRHIVQDGELYRLERLEEFGASAILYVLPDGSEAVFSIAVREYLIGTTRPAPILKGLIPSATYTLSDENGKELYRETGFELMTYGLPLETGGPVGYSHTVHLEKI